MYKSAPAFLHLPPGPNDQRGVTLVELLASMVIFSLCVVLMSNAFFQVQRLLGVVERSRDPAGQGLRLVGSLQEAVGHLIAREADAKAFTGDAQTFQTTTSRHPLGERGQPLPLQIRLARTELGDHLRIDALRPATGTFAGNRPTEQAAAIELAHAPDATVRLAYQAQDGMLFGQWPVPERLSEQLPSAVWLISRASGAGDAWPLRPSQLGQAGRSSVMAVWQYGGAPGWSAQNAANPFSLGGGTPGTPALVNPFGK